MSKLAKDLKVNQRYPLTVIVLITYRFGNWVYYYLKLPVIRQLFMILYRILDLIFVRICSNAQIPAQCKIGEALRLPHGGNGIIIHPKATIGKHATIFHQVTIGYKDTPTKSYGPPVLADQVYIGTGAKIIGDISIGQEAIIGANAVVIKDVPDKTTAVGIPARIISKASISSS